MESTKNNKSRSNKVRLDAATSNKIDVLLILLTKKVKQDHNNKEFCRTYMESLLRNIHNNIKSKGKGRNDIKSVGGGNLKDSITQLMILLMTMNTSLSSSLIPTTQNGRNDMNDRNDEITIRSIPSYTPITMLSSIQDVLKYQDSDYVEESKENVMRFKESEYITNSVKSFNRHYVSVVSNGGSQINTVSRINNMCRDVFLGSDVQTLLKNPEQSSTLLSSYFYSTTPTPTPTNQDDGNVPITDLNSFCELSFPIPHLFIDKRDKSVKLKITNSIGYAEIANMLDILYNSIGNNNLGEELNLKIQKLKYLTKRIRNIEDSARQPIQTIDKFTSVFYKVQEYLSSFESIEGMFGDPELLDESVRNGYKASFDAYLIKQATEQNSMMTSTKVDSYIRPFFSAVTSVSNPTIEFFTDSLESLLIGIHFDDRMRLLLLYAMGVIFGCVGIASYASKKHQRNTTITNGDQPTKKELQVMIKDLFQTELQNMIKYDDPPILSINEIIPSNNNSELVVARRVSSRRKITAGLANGNTKRKRCERGTRRDKKSGECVSNTMRNSLKKRCERGSRRDKKTGECVPNKKK